VQFAAETCQPCALRDACATAADGRSITLHPQEALLQQLRATTRTPDGRAALRRRTTVEHSLARLDQVQGKKARYIQRDAQEHALRTSYFRLHFVVPTSKFTLARAPMPEILELTVTGMTCARAPA
jgi:hypothetical protein